MNDTLLSNVREMQPELTSIRQNIHAHPDMAMEEIRTSTLVATKLKEWGITFTESIEKFDVVGTLKS
jgi:hippurate hydrolase